MTEYDGIIILIQEEMFYAVYLSDIKVVLWHHYVFLYFCVFMHSFYEYVFLLIICVY